MSSPIQSTSYSKEICSLALGASISGACKYSGGSVLESVAIGSLFAASLFGVIKLKSLAEKKIQAITQANIPEGNSTPHESKLSLKNISKLGLAAGFCFFGINHYIPNSFSRYAGLACVAPSMVHLYRSNFLSKATIKQREPVFTLEKDPNKRHPVAEEIIPKAHVASPSAYLDPSQNKWIISQEEVRRYNTQMGYVTDVTSAAELKQFVEEYANFPQPAVPIFGNSAKAGFSGQTDSAAARPEEQFSIDQAQKYLNLLKFGTECLPLVFEKTAFDTNDEYMSYYHDLISKRSLLIAEMTKKFQKWTYPK